MENVLLVVHILACIGLIGVVLLQRSEGGALGIGGGGGGGLMSGRGAASVLTRTTMILAGVFFLTSLTLTTIATRSNQSDSIITDQITDDAKTVPGVTDDLDVFDNLDAKLPEPEVTATPAPVPTPTPTASATGTPENNE